MMRQTFEHVLMASAATVCGFGVISPALAQDSGSPSTGGVYRDETIIVTARRRDELLQDVPQTVNAVSSDTIAKLRINNAADLSNIVPGVSIVGASTGASGAFGASSSVRGIPTFLTSNASPVVQFYLDDTPLNNGPSVSQSLFDIGQIEILKGPQGTLRGRSSPGGSITITTKRPDLDQVGGSFDLSGTDRGNIVVKGAVGAPIIEGVLGIRLAGLVDHSDFDGVTSANSPLDPFAKSEAVRATVLFQPAPNFTASVMYQKLWRNTRSFDQLVGPGNGVNGPVIAARDRLGITDGHRVNKNQDTILVGQVDWSFGGQKLSYVGSYRDGTSTIITPQDVANVLPGIEYYQEVHLGRGSSYSFSHELRLSSEERILNIFDYTIGAFYDKQKGTSIVVGPASFLPGAFGRPGTAPVKMAPLDRYFLKTSIDISPTSVEKSLFGNITAHITEATELSVGGRYIDFKRHDRFTLGLQPGFVAIQNPTLAAPGGPFPCAAIGLTASPVYTGSPSVCEVSIAANTLQDVDQHNKFTPFVYNIALSHRFTPDFLVYGNVGSAFRSAGPRIGFTSLLTCCTAAGGPDLGSIEDLVFQNREKSTSYELGFKASFLNKRARLNVAVFKQDFNNYYFVTQSVRYLSVTNPANLASGTVSTSEFTTGADASVKGIDVEAGIQITPRWDLTLGFSWAKGKLSNALIPCNDGNFDGQPDLIVPTAQDFVDHGTLVARCQSNASIARTPRWNLTAQSEYSAPLNNAIDGFVRGNFVYYPDNPNASEAVVIDKYAQLNMYLGIRDPKGGWEVSLFANNLLNEQQILSFNAVAPVSAGGVANLFPQDGASGYNQVSVTPRREFGLVMRYSFGSR
ncbi:MAG: TonB-dependent receptor [Novosphingobium sp.]|nr:TonB-dependent receptor [Novosphingobium sp.]MCP5403854.1 TonB-dependent receptor [Novosphingobium sp.]